MIKILCKKTVLFIFIFLNVVKSKNIGDVQKNEEQSQTSSQLSADLSKSISLLNVEPSNSKSSGFGVPLPPVPKSSGKSASKSINYDIKNQNTPLLLNEKPLAPILPKVTQQTPLLLGGAQTISNASHQPHIQALLSSSSVMKRLQLETRSSSIIRVHSIISAHQQTVSGLLTFLHLKLVETNCPLGSFRNASECGVKLDEDPYICEIAVWQRPWLNSTKIIDEKTRCAETESDNDFHNWNRGNRVLRKTVNYVTLPNLPTHLNKEQIGQEAFDYVNRGSESKFKGRLIHYEIEDIKHIPERNITAIGVALEYGFTLCLKFPQRNIDRRNCPADPIRSSYVCHVTVVSDPYLTINLKVDPGFDDEIQCIRQSHLKTLNSTSLGKSFGCPGCPQIASLNDPKILEVVNFALIEYDRRSDDDSLHRIVKLHAAHSQVVSGVKYYFTVEMAETDCRKPLSAINIDRTLCSRRLSEGTDICDFIIVDKPWQHLKQLTAANCFDAHEYPYISANGVITPPITKINIPSGAQVNFDMDILRSTIGANEFGIDSLGSTSKDGGASFGIPLVVDNTNQPQGGLGFGIPPVPNGVGVGSSGPTTQTQDFGPYKESIDFVMDALNTGGSYDTYKLIRAIRAISGTMHSGEEIDQLYLEVGETLCPPSTTNYNECPFEIDEDIEICRATVGKTIPKVLFALSCDDKEDFFPHLKTTQWHEESKPFLHSSPEGLGFPGGPIEKPTNDSKILSIASFIVQQYNLRHDDDELYRLTRVLESYSQVLSGVLKYTVEIELRETVCKKYNPIFDISNCPIDRSEDPEVCQAQVTENFGTVSQSSSLSSAKENFKLERIFCDEREDFYVKKLYYGSSRIGTGAQHTIGPTSSTTSTTSDKMTMMGNLIADKYDLWSDEDNLFVLRRVVSSQAQGSGLEFLMYIELSETVCPKYKRRIDKSRCALDIGEDIKSCRAIVKEKPWDREYEITNLRCTEIDDSGELILPSVHPSAHSRPRFVKSRYRPRLNSLESAESNERYYRRGSNRFLNDENESEENGGLDLDRNFFNHNRNFDHLNLGNYNRDFSRNLDRRSREDFGNLDRRSREDFGNLDRRSREDFDDFNRRSGESFLPAFVDADDDGEHLFENESRSIENFSSSSFGHLLPQLNGVGSRQKRAIFSGGFRSVEPSDPRVRSAAESALALLDSQNEVHHKRQILEVLEASRKVVSGLIFKLKFTLKNLHDDKNLEIGPLVCEVTYYEQVWTNTKEILQSNCFSRS